MIFAKKNSIDMLLINCSNLQWRPLYPYAFVQVSEIARRNGLKVKTLDLLNVENWLEKLQVLIKENTPTVIGIHVRQGDSLDLSDYDENIGKHKKYFRSYFPIEDARILIRMIREIANIPIVLGGFGFTTHAKKIAKYLEIDYGVQGCPDGFFANFNNVVSGSALDSVPGLVHSNSGIYKFNTVGFYNPSEHAEYTSEIITDIKKFYGPMLRASTPPTIAVEVARGCPFQCYFCTEPDIKGKRINWRNFDVVANELEFLLQQDIYDFWFICSELNIGGTDNAFKLAEIVLKLGEQYKRKPIRWSGYSLPSMTDAELAFLFRAGYTGAMNDILSLDDENLKKSKVPYKSAQAVSFLKSMVKLKNAVDGQEDESAKNAEIKFTASTPSQYSGIISFFFGNPYASEKTIATTLQRVSDENLSGFYTEGYVIPSTRVFSVGRTTEFVDKPTTVSYNANGITATDTKLPTFHFPEYLVNALGTHEKIHEFFEYISSTYMSRSHQKKKSLFRLFTALQNSEYKNIILSKLCSTQQSEGKKSFLKKNELNALKIPEETEELNENLHQILINEFENNYEKIEPVCKIFGEENFSGIKINVNEYEFAKHIYNKYDSEEHLGKTVAGIFDDSGIANIYFEYIKHITNVKIIPAYRKLMFNGNKNE